MLPLARKIASSVGIAEIVLLERQSEKPGCRSRPAIFRWPRCARETPGFWFPAAAEGYAAGTQVNAYMLREWDEYQDDRENPAAKNRRESLNQDQFLAILSREEALTRFQAALFPRPVPSEKRLLADALGLALSRRYCRADRRPALRPLERRRLCRAFRRYRRSFRSWADPTRTHWRNHSLWHRSRRPKRGLATVIATGGPMPRGADAVVMIEHTQPAGDNAVEVRRSASPGPPFPMPVPIWLAAKCCCAPAH